MLHTFYRMDDGSFLAFFEAPDMPFELKKQHDFDLHIALEVESEVLHSMFAKGKARAMETRGISDHEFVRVDLFPRPERLRGRADRKDAGARAIDGPDQEWGARNP